MLAALVFGGLASAEFLGEFFFARPSRESIEWAVRFQPHNAEFLDRLGGHYAVVEFAPEKAIPAYETATSLNPSKSRYWLDLADAYQEIGDTRQQALAVQRAIAVDPRSPYVAWQAANLFAVRDTPFALQQIRTVLATTPHLMPSALALAWRINPDIDSTLQQVIPPDPKNYYAFLDLLMAKKETDAAAKTWDALVQLNQPIERQAVFDYVRYLILESQVNQAVAVWHQAGSLTGLSAYQPSPQNLIVNGDFNLDVLNGGFDWLYNKSSDVSLALDPTEVFSGRRSLKIKFDSRSIEDAGIRELVPVQANTTYDFSAYYKATDMEGAGGPRIVLQDVYDQTIYFAGEEMKDSDDWKQAGGSFTTGSQSKLLVVRVQRVPVGRPIRGKIWIDNLSLTTEPK
jgi:Carbohydrate binding domain